MPQEIAPSDAKRALFQHRVSQRPPLSSSSMPTARDVAKMKLFPQSETTPLFGGGASTAAAAVGIYLHKPHTNPVRKSIIVSDSSANTNDGVDASSRCLPFRRSHSKPENPTSNMGARAIEEESCANAQKHGKKLIFLRNFSVSEEDVVVCNRVRCGVAPAWFTHRRGQDRRYLRSLSVEEMRLTATRQRANLSSVNPQQRIKPKLNPSLVVREDEPFPMTVVDDDDDDEDPALVKKSKVHVVSSKSNNSPQKISSPRTRVEPALQRHPSFTKKEMHPEDKPEDANVYMDSPKPMPREKAMHGRYLIRESFANGSYGKVCAGEAVASHQEIAVKIVPKYVLISSEEKQSVIREQIIHKSLNHPHIIKLIDVFEDEGAHYFILERADNGSLSTIISYSGLPESRCREVFKQLLSALEYLHRNNIVHHDIKPHNVLLHKGSSIKLCDFGASRAFNKNETSLPFAGVFGTPGYIAPELLMGDATYGPAIDMFSAGVLLFEMVFGYAPYYPPSSCTYAPLEFPRNCTASLQVRHLLSKLLQRDPAQRLTASQALGHPWITLGASGRSAPSSPVTSPRNLATPSKVW
ncbi:Serine/threonine protein kinase, partial [Globisporangium splendens]